MGAYRLNPKSESFWLVVNHELSGSSPKGVGARISRMLVNSKTRAVEYGEYIVKGTEGYQRICAGKLAWFDGEPWYFTAEESTSKGSAPAGGKGGLAVAVYLKTGQVTELPHMGYYAWENNVPLQGLSKLVFVGMEDGTAGTSQLYTYIANDLTDALGGKGQLYVWKPDATPTDGNASSNDIAKGQSLAGRFVPLSQTDNGDAKKLEAAAQAAGAFDFVRIEDGEQSLTDPTVLYFNDTGAAGQQSVKGRVYEMKFDKADPTKATLTVLLDGDAGDDNVNPDNMGISKTSLIIQEDRNAEHRAATVSGGYGRVLKVDLATKAVPVVARVNNPADLPPGEMESSGVLDASEFLGKDGWILNVQGHGKLIKQPGPDLAVNSSEGEDGQIIAIKIPNSQ